MEEQVKKACDMLSTALEMEEKGKAFYDKSAKKCKNEQCREIFRMLGEDEISHMDRIKTIHDSLTEKQTWCDDWKEIEPEYDLQETFRKITKEHGANVSADTSDMEALDIGIDFEARSIKFYREKEAAARNPIEKEFFSHMVSEEKEHHAALIDMKLYLENPSSWFNEKERIHLDGA